jgi:hypothetical protein
MLVLAARREGALDSISHAPFCAARQWNLFAYRKIRFFPGLRGTLEQRGMRQKVA